MTRTTWRERGLDGLHHHRLHSRGPSAPSIQRSKELRHLFPQDYVWGLPVPRSCPLIGATSHRSRAGRVDLGQPQGAGFPRRSSHKRFLPLVNIHRPWRGPSPRGHHGGAVGRECPDALLLARRQAQRDATYVVSDWGDIAGAAHTFSGVAMWSSCTARRPLLTPCGRHACTPTEAVSEQDLARGRAHSTRCALRQNLIAANTAAM